MNHTSLLFYNLQWQQNKNIIILLLVVILTNYELQCHQNYSHHNLYHFTSPRHILFLVIYLNKLKKSYKKCIQSLMQEKLLKLIV